MATLWRRGRDVYKFNKFIHIEKHAMRTNIEIDDTLMSEALTATGIKTKREAVELGLKTIIRLIPFCVL